MDILDAFAAVGLHTAGAGRHVDAAAAPAVLPVAGAGRVRVYGLATASSGVPAYWAAGADRPGILLLPDLSDRQIDEIAIRIRRAKRPGDAVVVSIHWCVESGDRSGPRRD